MLLLFFPLLHFFLNILRTHLYSKGPTVLFSLHPYFLTWLPEIFQTKAQSCSNFLLHSIPTLVKHSAHHTFILSYFWIYCLLFHLCISSSSGVFILTPHALWSTSQSTSVKCSVIVLLILNEKMILCFFSLANWLTGQRLHVKCSFPPWQEDYWKHSKYWTVQKNMNLEISGIKKTQILVNGNHDIIHNCPLNVQFITWLIHLQYLCSFCYCKIN